MSRENILIVEDDEDIREGVRILLESESFHVDEASNGTDALKMVNGSTDLVILDIMMPGISGLKTCEELRKTSNVPVLFLTAKSQESDKLIGLMAGGDDYLPKPFSYSELLGRVKALIRRYKTYKGKDDPESEEEKYIQCGNLRINTKYNEVSRGEKEISISDIEYRILLLLMQHRGKIFSAQNIYESVWNEPYFYNNSNTVMVHIRKLRMAIEPTPEKPKYIKTIWGKGYRFENQIPEN